MAEPFLVHHGKLHYYFREVFKRLRVPARDASKVADVLVAAELYGIESEGAARVPAYLHRISSGLVNLTPRLKVTNETDSAATLQGDNGLGPVVAAKAMDLAILKAERTGIAAVAVRNSNHFGPAGYYARLALARDMMGIALTNGHPDVVPRPGAPPLVGANPLAIAAPTRSGRAFVLDMATSSASPGKIEALHRRGEPIPKTWALDKKGSPTRDAGVALESLRLLPLGNDADGSSYKGFGLAVAVDVLCGVLSGGAFGLELAAGTAARPGVANVGHFFAAIKIKAFGSYPQFVSRNQEMLDRLVDPPGPRLAGLRYPGELQHETEEARRRDGIPLAPDVAKELARIGRSLGLQEAWEQLRSSRETRTKK